MEDQTAADRTEPAWACRLKLTNDRKKPIVVQTEPWAEDYTLFPGETVDIVATGTSDDSYLHWCENEDEVIQIWAEGSCNEILVFQNGKQLYCGHRRYRKEWGPVP